MSRKNADGIYVNYDKVSCDRYRFDGTAESVKAYIDEIVEKAKEKGMVGEGRFDFSISRAYYDDYEFTVDYEFERVETEKEKAAREKAATRAKEEAAKNRRIAAEKKKLKENSEYIEFLRLKEKFKDIDK